MIGRRISLSTLILLQVAAAAILGWVVDHVYHARSCSKRMSELRDQANRDRLHLGLLQAIVSARDAKTRAEYERACIVAREMMGRLASLGPSGQDAKEAYVASARVDRWPGSEYEFALDSPLALASLGSEGVPFIIELLGDKDVRVRTLGIQSLRILVDERIREPGVVSLTGQQAREIEGPLRHALETEQDENVTVALDRLLEVIATQHGSGKEDNKPKTGSE